MNVLLVGSGGREHALAWKISQSPKLSKLFITPGNPGTGEFGENVQLDLDKESNLKEFLNYHKIDCVVVGPEIPLVNGLHDKIQALELDKKPIVIGPKKEGAILEGSKKFAKEFMQRHNIPTAKYRAFNKENIGDAKKFLQTLDAPYVLKADGLAAGKGVLIIDDLDEAFSELTKIIEDKKFGSAGDEVVIEEFLKGIELSVFVLSDGKNYMVLPSAKDYKRIGEGDTGLNTGGMGAISPAPSANKSFMDKVEQRVIIPTVQGFLEDNIDYQGFIFIGLMDVQGEPQVIEYNVRLGDPETEVILPRIENDLLQMFEAVGNKSLNKITTDISTQNACTVMMVSGGYPESYEKGKVISGLNEISDAQLFQAGTKSTNEGIVTNGGRVLAVTCVKPNLNDALDIAYRNMAKIKFEKNFYRKDIGYEVRNTSK